MDGERFVQNGAVRSNPQWGPDHELDQLVWFASSSLNDLCAALGDSAKVPTITLRQLDELKDLVVLAQRVHARGRRIDLPPHEFNGES